MPPPPANVLTVNGRDGDPLLQGVLLLPMITHYFSLTNLQVFTVNKKSRFAAVRDVWQAACGGETQFIHGSKLRARPSEYPHVLPAFVLTANAVLCQLCFVCNITCTG